MSCSFRLAPSVRRRCCSQDRRSSSSIGGRPSYKCFAGDRPVQMPLRRSRPASAIWWRRYRPAKDARLHLTIADVHATSRIPVSTLRWLCKHKPELLGAQKHEGVWYINRAKFERYMATSDREVPMRRTTQRVGEGNAVEAA